MARGKGITEGINKVLASSRRAFMTAPELLKACAKAMPGANMKTVAVLINRDMARRKEVIKLPWRTTDFSTTGRWMLIYAVPGREQECKLEALQKRYKNVKSESEVFAAIEERKAKKRKTKVPKARAKPSEKEEARDEISAYEFGRKVITYIEHLKIEIRQKDDELARVLRNYKTDMQDKKNQIATLNKKITTQNEEIEKMQKHFKRIPREERDKVFKLSEVAHIS